MISQGPSLTFAQSLCWEHTKVTNADLDTHANGSLVGASKIVAEPGDVGRLALIDGACGDEDAGVCHSLRLVSTWKTTWVVA